MIKQEEYEAIETKFCYNPSKVNKDGSNTRPTIFNNIEISKGKPLNVVKERGRSDPRPLNHQSGANTSI